MIKKKYLTLQILLPIRKEKVSDILSVRNTKRIIHFVRNLDNQKQYVPRYDIVGLGDIVNYFYQKKSKVKNRPTYWEIEKIAGHLPSLFIVLNL